MGKRFLKVRIALDCLPDDEIVSKTCLHCSIEPGEITEVLNARVRIAPGYAEAIFETEHDYLVFRLACKKWDNTCRIISYEQDTGHCK